VSGFSLALHLHCRGVALRADGDVLEVDAPMGVLSNNDLVALEKNRDSLVALARDLGTLQADDTALFWRVLHESLSEMERERLEAEANAGDSLAELVLLTVTASQPALIS
jgi:hypothetical protein